MHLTDVPDVLTINSSLGAEIITSAEVRKIFYLITGRNAWHSTWVRHYYKRCMSTESRDLEYDAEKMRGPGTTFQIDEIPALCLGLQSGCLIITELNTTEPLKNYSPKYVPTVGLDILLKGQSEKSIFTGNTFANVLQSLNSQECWKLQKKDSSLLRLFAKDLRPSDLEESTQKYLSKVSGSSGGNRNSLSWSVKTGNRSDEFIKSLALSSCLTVAT